MKRRYLLFLIILSIFIVHANDWPHPVIFYLEDASGNYPSSSEITFSATLKEADEDVVGTITNSTSLTSKYVAESGILIIECSNFSTWDSGYYLEVSITYDGTETINLNDADFDRITLDNDSYQRYDGFDGNDEDGDYTSFIFGIPTGDPTGDQADIEGKDADMTSSTSASLTFTDNSGGRANTNIEATMSFNDAPGQTITIRQYDAQNRTIPAYENTLPLTFDIVYGTSDIDYNSSNGNPATYTFSWEDDTGINLTGTDDENIIALYSIDNGVLWQEITNATSDVTLSANYSGTGNTYGNKTYGIAISITSDIHNVGGRAHTSSNLSFAFGQGDGDDLLALSPPVNLSGSVDTSIFGDYEYYLSWDPVAGATSYLVEEYGYYFNNENSQWEWGWYEAEGEYKTLIKAFKFDFNHDEKLRLYRVKAVSDANHYNTETDAIEIFLMHEYYIEMIAETNNNLIILPVDNTGNEYPTDPEEFAELLDCCDVLAQWDGDSWNECYYNEQLDMWINNSNFQMDFSKPILINATIEKNLFMSGTVKSDLTYTFNASNSTEYYICIPGDITTDDNTVSQLIGTFTSQSITVTKIYRFNNTNKNWYEMENTETFYPGQLVKVIISAGNNTWPDRSGRTDFSEIFSSDAGNREGGEK